MKQGLRTIVGLVTLLMIAGVTSVWAGIVNQPPPIPGWTHSPRFVQDTPEGHGIILSGNVNSYASPAIADIDGDSTNGLETIVSTDDGRVYAYGANGRLRWEKQTAELFPNGCGNDTTQHILSKPAVGQLYGDGINYVVIGLGSVVDTNPTCVGGVVALDGRNGNQRWYFNTRDWLASQGRPSESNYSVLSSPALADTDGDGLMEIGFGGLDRYIYLLSATRNNQGYSVRWFYHPADSVWSSPAFADINGDRRLELITGADISANGELNPPTQDGGYVYAFDTRARNPVFVDFQAPNAYLWRTFFDQVIYSSPAIGDVLDSNPGQEVVVGSGCNFPAGNADKRGKWVKILRLSDGAVLQTLNIPSGGACVQSSPALGDLDDDGRLEVVVGSGWRGDSGSDGRSRLVAWDAEQANPKWVAIPADANSTPGASPNNAGDVNLNSPVIADLDGNGSLEVLFADFWSVGVYNGATGAQLTSTNSGDALSSMFAWGTLFSTPAVADLTGDGPLEVVIAGRVFPGNLNNRGMLYGWTGLSNHITSPDGNLPSYSTAWPQLRGNAANTGRFVVPQIEPSLSSITRLLAPGEQVDVGLTFTNSATGSLNWAVIEDDPEDIIALSRDSGNTADRLTITLSAAQPGTYQASVLVQSAGLPDVTIPVTLIVDASISRIYLPTLQR